MDLERKHKIASIFDLEDHARKRLPAVLFDYIHGGSEQQLTLQRNLLACRRYCSTTSTAAASSN